MAPNEQLRIYNQLVEALNCRPRESLQEAAKRYSRYGKHRVLRQVARAVLAISGKQHEAAWDAMADAADLLRPAPLRPQLVN